MTEILLKGRKTLTHPSICLENNSILCTDLELEYTYYRDKGRIDRSVSKCLCVQLGVFKPKYCYELATSTSLWRSAGRLERFPGFVKNEWNKGGLKLKMNFEWYGPRQANLVLIAYASSEGSGEPAHPRSLARTFAARSYKQWVKRNLQTESQIPGPSEWLGMRSWNLSWRNARRHKFAWRGSYDGWLINALNLMGGNMKVCSTLLLTVPRRCFCCGLF